MSRTVKVFCVLLIALLIALPWLVNPYKLQILILMITYAMLGLAFSFTMTVGLPRFDIAAWWGVGAYTTALLMKRGMPFLPTILIGGAIAVILGYLIFTIAIPRGMMVFLLFGMAAAMTIQQIFGSVKFFGGWGGTGVIPTPSIFSISLSSKSALYFLGLIFLTFNVTVFHLFYKSRIGRAWNAIGSSIKLAGSAGVNVTKYRMANVLISNFFLAMAGSYFVAYSLVAVPDSFGFHKSIYVMMYVVIGGFEYRIAGPIIGALILTIVPEYLRIAREFESIFSSVIILLIIIFMPIGILGWVDKKIRPWILRKSWNFLFGKKRMPLC